MKAAVEGNRSLLRSYQRAARVVSWVLLCGGIFWLLLFIFWVLAAMDAAGELRWPGTSRNLGYAISTFVFSFLIPGSLGLLIAQFVGYVLDAEGKAGWILRHGDWILYACGVILIGQAALRLTHWDLTAVSDADQAGLLFIGPSLVPLVAKVLICLALGQILRRMLPIVDESKTLV